MMQDSNSGDRIREIEKGLEKNLADFYSSADETIQSRLQILNGAMRELIEAYSNQIRNLGLISGVVAPFSLTLLQIQRLDIYSPLLLLGFTLLLGNIILAQLLLGRELKRKDSLKGKATLELISATLQKDLMADYRQPVLDRVKRMPDFLKNIEDFDKYLVINPHSIELMNTSRRLRAYNKWVVIVFSIGCGFISISVFFNGITTFIIFSLFKLTALFGR